MKPGPIKWHGGKAYLAKEIVALMPPRCKTPNKPADDDKGWLHYVEPYFGGGAVLLANDPEGISEVVNDLNRELAFFWHTLANIKLFPDFLRRVEATQFSEELWDKSTTNPVNCLARLPADSAADFFVRCRQSLAGRMDSFTGITKTRTRRGMNNEVSAWLTAIDGLPAVHARLKRVLILNRDALDVIRSQDGPQTLFYLDPPYLHETRNTTKEYGEFEMTEQQHIELLSELVATEGKWMLSGYQSKLYESFFKDFPHKRHDFEIDNKAAGGKTKRRMVESVWCNWV